MLRSKPISDARWSAFCIAGALSAASAFCWTNYRLDLYGLFGKDHDRGRIVYSNERSGKYLLSLRYVPERFEGLLVGTSITDNWDTAKVAPIRMYNGSINGGNISEAKLIADNVLDRKNLTVVVFCIHPYLTATHGRKAGGMDAQEFWGALGSLQLLRDYLAAFLISRGLKRSRWNASGAHDFEVNIEKRIGWEQASGPGLPETLPIDPSAYSEFAELVNRARSQGATVVRMFPPIYYDRWFLHKAEFDEYFARMSALFRPEEPAIDFNAPEFDGIRKRRDMFSDGYHLSKAGGDTITTAFGDAIRRCCSRDGHDGRGERNVSIGRTTREKPSPR